MNWVEVDMGWRVGTVAAVYGDQRLAAEANGTPRTNNIVVAPQPSSHPNKYAPTFGIPLF